MDLPKKEQFSGCLIGQSLGDALGFPVEGAQHEICKDYGKQLLKLSVNMTGREPYPLGQYSDDSQLARELLISYRDCKMFDPGDYARRIADIFSRGRIVGSGRATFEAAMRLDAGTPWQEAGTPSPSAGNGSAMRAGPVGLLFFDNVGDLIRSAYDQSRITHQDPRCCACSVAIAGAVALCLRKKSLDSKDFLIELSEWTGPIESSVSNALKRLAEWVEMPPENTMSLIAQAGYAPGYSNEWQGLTPFVTGTVLWSLYSFLHTPQRYLDTIVTAISVGGDVDSTAAMAGAISGAFLGRNALPNEMVKLLTDKGRWGLAELTKLAHECFDVKMQSIS
ncbi:MAG: ADP-ribosylglycohydrolase family protein [Deltaproteobacteria bacterium]|nr:ADP-ribosylglycohydrolase family protein [Deltaproteobacteria bacterium]